jgi:hypothetical protein
MMLLLGVSNSEKGSADPRNRREKCKRKALIGSTFSQARFIGLAEQAV